MKACLQCDTELESDFCPDCGSESEELIECAYCGKPQVDSGSGECIDCGQDIEWSE